MYILDRCISCSNIHYFKSSLVRKVILNNDVSANNQYVFIAIKEWKTRPCWQFCHTLKFLVFLKYMYVLNEISRRSASSISFRTYLINTSYYTEVNELSVSYAVCFWQVLAGIKVFVWLCSLSFWKKNSLKSLLLCLRKIRTHRHSLFLCLSDILFKDGFGDNVD